MSSVTSNMSLQIDPLVGTSTSISCYGANDASLIVSIASSSSSVGLTPICRVVLALLVQILLLLIYQLVFIQLRLQILMVVL